MKGALEEDNEISLFFLLLLLSIIKQYPYVILPYFVTN